MILKYDCFWSKISNSIRNIPPSSILLSPVPTSPCVTQLQRKREKSLKANTSLNRYN